MKRFLLAGALVLAGAGFTWSAHADPAPCASGDTVNNTNPTGVVCAGGDAGSQSGHVYADGNDSNPGLSQGYIGANSNEGVVGCANGDYNQDEGQSDPSTHNNVILDPSDPAGAVPSIPPSTDGACNPSAP